MKTILLCYNYDLPNEVILIIFEKDFVFIIFLVVKENVYKSKGRPPLKQRVDPTIIITDVIRDKCGRISWIRYK